MSTHIISVNMLKVATFLVLLWSVERKELFFVARKDTRTDRINLSGNSWMKEFQHCHGKNEKRSCKISQKWTKPEEGWSKSNFDAAWDKHRGIGGIMLMIHNDRDEFVVALAKRHAAVPFPLLPETMAARDAAWLLMKKQLQDLVFEGDALLVLAALQQDSQEDYSRFRNILNDTCSMIQPLPQWKIGFSRRETNKVVHKLA